MRNSRRRWTGAVLAAMLAALAGLVGFTEGRTSELRYALSIQDNARVGYDLPIQVRHPGMLTVRAEWSGSRVLFFRLERPDGSEMHRTGSSPLRIDMPVEPEHLTGEEPWKLIIRGLAMRGSGEGTLVVRAPQPPEAPDPGSSPSASNGEATEARPPRVVPHGSPPAWSRFVVATEGFRETLARSDAPDACRWQTPLMTFLDDRTDDLLKQSEAPSRSTREALDGIVKTIRRVEGLRSSDDPLLIGPPPEDPDRRTAWLRLRGEEIRTLEAELDDVSSDLARGHAPELEDEAWPLRLMACITACERHFEERVRLGEGRATNLDLANDQWDRVLAAGRTLAALVAVEGDHAGTN